MHAEIIKIEDAIIRDEEFIAIMDDDNSFSLKMNDVEFEFRLEDKKRVGSKR